MSHARILTRIILINPPGRSSQPLLRRGSLVFRLVVLSIAFLTLAYLVAAQDNQPASYQGFEGRTVSAVDISANPKMDIQEYKSLVKISAGAPFSIAGVRESVAALQQTKLFSKVQVRIDPEQNGLHVTFLLEPTYYVGMVFFPGATKSFSYTRLLQAVNIPDQSPFVEDLTVKAKAALLQLLQTSGYFAASVEPETQRDDAHRVVNILFHCNLGKRARVGRIDLQGASAAQSADLRSSLTSLWARLTLASLKPGQRYSRHRILRAMNILRAHFRKESRLTPTVRLASTNYDAATNRANIAIEVDPGPLVSVRLTGAHISQRKLKKLIPIYEENAVDKGLVDEGRRNLISYFQSKSYFEAKVDSHLDRQSGALNVVYEVDRGKRHHVKSVAFEGNAHFTASQLRPYVAVKKAALFFSHGHFSNDLLRKSVDSLKAFYINAGFAKVSIQPKVVDRDPDIAITFEISEGTQDKVNSLSFVNAANQAFQPRIGKRPLNVMSGKPYSSRLLDDDRNQILAYYLNHGYLNAHFDSTSTPLPGQPNLVNVIYRIEEGPQVHIDQVAILGATHTKPKLIRAITKAHVQESQPLSQGGSLTAESDLYNVGVFDWASVGPLRPVENQSHEEVLIKVHESKRNTLDVGGGLEVIPRSGNIPVGAVALPGLPQISLGSKFTASQKSFVGPRVTFQFARRDLWGLAQTASVGFVFSRLDQRGSFNYSDPRIYGSSWSALFSVSGERTTQNPIFTAEFGQASLQAEKGLNTKRNQHLRLRYSFQRTDLSNILIPDLVLPRDQRVRLSTVATEYVRDTRDKPLDAHRGIFQSFSVAVTPTAFGSSSDFVKFLGQTSFYRPVRPWLTWANNFRLGLATPFAGSFVPLSESFFSGGADSLRGFPINGAGPQRPVTVCGNPNDTSTCTLISVPVGGEMLAIFNSEARFPIPLKSGLGGVVFYDGGNVYSKINFNQFINNYSNSIGVGLRYQTPVGPIRVDIGRNLNPIPGVRATQYFITLGQSF